MCNMNLGQFPLTITPPPSHIVLQGVWLYVYDKLLVLNAFACAYPKAVWITDALFDPPRDTNVLLADFGAEFGFTVTSTHGSNGNHPLLVFTPVEHNETKRVQWRRTRCHHAARADLVGRKRSQSAACHEVSGSSLPRGRPALKNHAFYVGR